MANNYYDPIEHIPFTIVKAADFNTSEGRTEKAFDFLPEPITTGSKGFTENFEVQQPPTKENHVVRLADMLTDVSNYGEATSTDSIHYNLTIDPGPSAYVNGVDITVGIPSTNTGQAFLNLNSLGDREIVKFDGTSLTGGELVENQIVEVSFKNNQFQLLSHTSAVAPEAPTDGKAYVRKNSDWYEGADKSYIDNQDNYLQNEIDSNSSDISVLDSRVTINESDISDIQNQLTDIGFPSGTRLMFHQNSPPVGWSLVDLGSNCLLRVNTSSDRNIHGSHNPILMNVVPSHTHSATGTANSNGSHAHGHVGYNKSKGTQGYPGFDDSGYAYDAEESFTAGSHTHSLSITVNSNSGSNWTPKYTDVIICEKD